MTLFDRITEGDHPSVEWPNLDEMSWVETRRSGIGASSSAAIFGCGHEGTTQLTVYEQIVHPELAPKLEGEHLDIGQLLERPIGQMYAEQEGRTLWFNDRRIWRSREHNFITCTPDFIDWENQADVQTKNVSVFAGKEWENGETPLKYEIQCQHELYVTGMDYAVLVGLIGGNHIEHRIIERNDKFIKALVKKLVDFWENHVVKRIPPDPTEAADFDVINRLHPDDNGKAVRVDIDESLLKRWKKATRIRLACEKIEKRAKAMAAAKVGDNTYGVCGDHIVRFKTQEKKGHYVKPSKFRVASLVKSLPKGTEVEE